MILHKIFVENLIIRKFLTSLFRTSVYSCVTNIFSLDIILNQFFFFLWKEWVDDLKCCFAPRFDEPPSSSHNTFLTSNFEKHFPISLHSISLHVLYISIYFCRFNGLFLYLFIFPKDQEAKFILEGSLCFGFSWWTWKDTLPRAVHVCAKQLYLIV